MKTNKIIPKDIDEYIASFPKDIQEILEKIRTTIRKAAPDAEEIINYQIPTFTLKGRGELGRVRVRLHNFTFSSSIFVLHFVNL